MSAHADVTNEARRRRVLFVAANPAISQTTGWPIGFWWAELTHPYWAFTEAGYEVEIRSPDGGALEADSYSDPEDPSGYSAHDLLSEAGKVTALVCHGTCLLLETTLGNGELLVKGKTWTGFANSEERYADTFVGRRIQPFWIEDEARQLPETNFIVDQMFRQFAVRDGLLVTGQQQFSGAAAAHLVIEALGR